MSERGLFFVGAGLLFALRPSAAPRYLDSASNGQRRVRYVAALALGWNTDHPGDHTSLPTVTTP